MTKSQKKRAIVLAMVFIVILMTIAGTFIGRNYYIKNNYPLDHVEIIQKYSEKYNFDPVWVAAIIRQESKFKADAGSPAGAIGLMQLMPDTAKWICEMRGTKFDKSKLTDPEYNIDLGTWYLNYLMKMFDGEKDVVLAAYNAGQGQTKTWLKDKNYSSDGKTLQNIPFEETRDYVRLINEFFERYEKYHGKELRG